MSSTETTWISFSMVFALGLMCFLQSAFGDDEFPDTAAVDHPSESIEKLERMIAVYESRPKVSQEQAAIMLQIEHLKEENKRLRARVVECNKCCDSRDVSLTAQ